MSGETGSTDEQEPRLACYGIGSPVNAGRDRAARIVDGDAPQMSHAEGIRNGSGERSVVQVVKALFQVFAKSFAVFASEESKQSGAGLGNINVPPRVLVAQALAGSAVICTKVRVRFGGGCIYVKGTDIRAQGARIFHRRVAVDAFQYGIETVLLKGALVLQEDLHGRAARGTQREEPELLLIDRGDPSRRGQQPQYLAEIARKRIPSPAEGIDPVDKGRVDEFIKTRDEPNARIIERQRKWQGLTNSPPPRFPLPTVSG